MICVVGEALIDLVVAPSGDAVAALPGGAPMNVAVTVARLGAPARFLGRTSTDAFGTRLRAHLAGEGVDTTGAPTGDEPTAVALVTTDAHGHPSYRFLWDDTADRSLTLDALPDDLGADDALVIGGVSTILEPGASVIEALAQRERSRRTLVLDPNVRPQFVTDRVAYRERVERLVALAHLVKVSDEDLRWLSDVDAGTTARRWAADGRVVIVTRGARGPFLVHDGAVTDVPGETVEVVDTVGAGDAFLGATVTWLAEHDRLARDRLPGLSADEAVELLRFATHVAAITCTRPGADPPHRAELARH